MTASFSCFVYMFMYEVTQEIHRIAIRSFYWENHKWHVKSSDLKFNIEQEKEND